MEIMTNETNTTPEQKSICLSCKGTKKKRSVVRMIASILAVIIGLPLMMGMFVQEGVPVINFVIAVPIILLWGFRSSKCPVCDGLGSIVL